MKLRFTIRDLLWLTLLVAMAVGWYVDRSYLKRDYESQTVHEIIQQSYAEMGLPQVVPPTGRLSHAPADHMPILHGAD